MRERRGAITGFPPDRQARTQLFGIAVGFGAAGLLGYALLVPQEQLPGPAAASEPVAMVERTNIRAASTRDRAELPFSLWRDDARAAPPVPGRKPSLADRAPSRVTPAAKPVLARKDRLSPAATVAARPPADERRPSSGQPMISIVIDDMGLDRRRSRTAVALPAKLTLSYLPYARDIGAQVRAARARGHELFLHLPMEAQSRAVDPGPRALSPTSHPRETMRRLRWALSRFDGFVGVNNHMGSRFTSNANAMRLVLKELARHRLIFLDSKTTPRSVARPIANALGLPFAARDVFLDDHQDGISVRTRLQQLERIARRQGHAIAIGHPRDRTLVALRNWLSAGTGRAFRIVPVTRIVMRGGDLG